MLADVLRSLAPRPGETFLDATFGAGGYSQALLEAGATVIAIDRDPQAIARAAPLRETYGDRLTVLEGLFGELDDLAQSAGAAAVDGVVLDIGVSSPQLEEAARGFSFRRDGPLDMRMGGDGPTAADIVNTADERDLARILKVLGEERRARHVAHAIAVARSEAAITTTLRLAGIVEKVVRKAADGIHPATRTFQALRLYVNRELEELAAALGAAERILREGGRLVVVAFHSLEDRIVKRFLGDRSRERGGGSRHLPDVAVPDPTFRLLTKGAAIPTPAETAANPRARSARLRAAVRTGAPARPIDPEALGVPRLPAVARA
jgi:16S rRNA (cytosine1402-N4)-methyltransferase